MVLSAGAKAGGNSSFYLEKRHEAKMKVAFLKRMLIHFFYFSGVPALFHYFARHKITILYLHSIIDVNKAHAWLPLRDFTSLQALDNTLAILNQHYQFLSLSDAAKILLGKQKPVNNGLVITLDDGYRNNIDVASEVFAKYRICPTIFVVSQGVSKQTPFWFDQFDYLLQQVIDAQLVVSLQGEDFSFDCRSRESLTHAYARFRARVKHSFDSDIEMNQYLQSLASQLETKLGRALKKDDPHSALVNWRDLRRVVNSAHFEIGAHTVNHFRLSQVDEVTMTRELKGCQRSIEKHLDVRCHALCYPDNSYNKQVIKKAQSYYAMATTTDLGLNAVGQDMMTLKRLSFPTGTDAKRLLFSISAFRHCLR